VGGGYADTALSSLALRWIAEKASECDLELDTADLFTSANALGELHNSYTGFYRGMLPHHRALVGTIAGAMAPSVDERYAGADPLYRPRRLKAWLQARA
jgi:hypothetical protein